MSEIDDIITEIQHAAKVLGHRTGEHADRAMLELLLRLAWRVQELESHQHTYVGPLPGAPHRWYPTQAQREIVNPSEKVFEQQAAAKLADKKDP
jgi:hypothetical protein